MQLYITKVDKTLSKEDLTNYFKCSDIALSEDRPKFNYGYVTFDNNERYNECLSLGTHSVNGHEFYTKEVRAKRNNDNILIVYGLNKSLSVENIGNFFSKWGTISDVSVSKPNPKFSDNKAYITFSDSNAVYACYEELKQSGMELDGSVISVSPKVRKTVTENPTKVKRTKLVLTEKQQKPIKEKVHFFTLRISSKDETLINNFRNNFNGGITESRISEFFGQDASSVRVSIRN